VPIRVVVSQTSPPIRILLVLAVAVLGLYMFFLRPKPEEIPPVEPAGTSVSQPGKIRDAAEDAVEAANGQLAQQESVDGVEAGESAAGTRSATKGAGTAPAATPAEDLKGLPKPLRKAIRADKILVVLFSNGTSYDDKAVETALTKINRWDGGVYVHTAPLRKISRYGRIARGVSVEQSPTVVVADRDLRAETLVGYVDRTRIDQAVLDARRNTSGLYVDAYLKAADKVCFAHSNRWDSVPFYWKSTPPQTDRRLRELDTVWASFAADFEAIDAPKKWAAFHKDAVADINAYGAFIHRTSVSFSPNMKRSVYSATVTEVIRSDRPLRKSVDRDFDGANLPRCGSQF